MDFNERLDKEMTERSLHNADLARMTGLSTGVISQLRSGKTKDPRLETMIAVAQALDISLDWLAGRKDSKEFVSNAEIDILLEGFKQLPREDRKTILDQVEFMVAKKKETMSDNSVSEIA